MEADEIVALTVHRRVTEEELAMADTFSVKRPTSARTTQFAFAASPAPPASPHQSSGATTPQVAVQMQTPTNPQPIGSVQTRPSSAVDMTAHCTS